MIDYQKLALAHELANKAGSYICYAYENENGNFVNWVDLDQLILELKELTKPQPKYKVGQLVYCFHRDEIISFIIEDIKITDSDVWYSYRENESQVNEFIETILFSTRQALIDARIEYWQSLKHEETSTCPKNVSMECEHEYTTQSGFACAKCGYNAVKDGGADSDCDTGEMSYDTYCKAIDFFRTNGGKCREHENDDENFRKFQKYLLEGYFKNSDKGCKHEHYVKMPTLYDGGIVQKCKKCKEFYR